MNRALVFLVIGVLGIGLLTLSTMSDQFADAGSRKKIHFTQTITSTQDPGIGHESHQLGMILSPNKGTIYDGSMTFSSSEPVQIVVLHEINKDDSKGQPTWSVDGKTIYSLSLVDLNKKSGSFEFTGAALALHSPSSEEFTATVSLDGWIRGQPTEIIMHTSELKEEKQPMQLSRVHVPATIPMHKGLYNGQPIYYIITDSSNAELAETISTKQEWSVETAPPLANTPKEAMQKTFVFTNGVKGEGIYGFQENVFSSTPSSSPSTQSQYSALNSVIEVKWKKGQNMIVLDSEEKITEAHEGGRIELNDTGHVINAPQIIWPDGQMKVREDKEITDDLAYGGGQVTEINKEEMTVTFVAHRGWGPDGKTIYYIVTDATPSVSAEMMGVPHSATSSNLMSNSAAVDLFQFQNGIIGSGPLGFQPGIAAAAPGDENYSPMWRIYLVEWNDPDSAKILETRSDIDSFKEEGKINISIARPMNSEHVVNCPFINPFQ